MRLTTKASTGHLAIFQMVTAVEPKPISLPMASASGPVTTSAIRTRAKSIVIPRVTSTCSGRSFQNGRPSGDSKMALDARMKAPM